MTELSPRARTACAALRADGADHDERERVRARLSLLGVAMGAGVSTGLTATATSAAASSAGTTMASVAPTAAPAAALSHVTGVTGFAGGALATKGALVGAATAGKLAGVPLVIKAGLAVLAVSSALAAPKLFPPAREASRPTDAASVNTNTAARAQPAPSAARRPEPSETPQVTALAPRPRIQTRERTGSAPVAARKPSIATSPTVLPQPESTLAAETALLASALSALRSGRSERARDLLTRHEETYGTHALLARERERMRQELSHLLR